jgi:4-hydroxy-4-methyl-2-oxoglutarate aldolase
VRDVDALARHGFPVFSTGIALPGATKNQPGAVGKSRVIGGVDVHDGDWVVGDTDGVTVIPVDALDDVIAAGRAREAKEQGFFKALQDGQTTIELLSLDPTLIVGE